jgi:SSS family solute:Na+ symporter
LIAGSGLAISGILARIIWSEFPLNGMQVSFCASLSALTLYVVISLLTCKEDFNMDRMLHRSEYARITEVLGGTRDRDINTRRGLLARAIGIDKNFTRGDKWIASGLLAWSLFWVGVFIVGGVWNLIAPWPEHWWSSFWHVAGVGIPIFMALVTAVWFTWGGTRDIVRLFRHLKAGAVNELDDGTVVGHQNLDEAALRHDSDGATACDDGEEQPSCSRTSDARR